MSDTPYHPAHEARDDGTATPRDLEEELRSQASRYRRVIITFHTIGMITTLIIGIVVLITMFRLYDATGPEAQERQGIVVDQLVVRINCNNQATTQAVLDELVERGVLANGESIVESDCRDIVEDKDGE